MTTSGATIEEINARYPLYIRRFAAGQFLSNLAYLLSLEKTLPLSVKVLRENGAFSDYIVKPFLLKKGMCGYILLPADKSLKDVKVIFRGTDFSDPKSVAINLEMRGPGSASFAYEEKNIFHTFKQALQEYYQTDGDLTLDVCGHSQGAVFTQLFIDTFLKHRANSNDFDRIKKLNMVALNSPGGSRGLAQSTAQSVQKQFEEKPLKIIANYGMVGGDAVQVTGFDMIFSDLPPEVVELNLLKVDKKLEGNWLRAFELEDGLQLEELWNMGLRVHANLHGAHSNVNFYAPVDSTGKITVNSHHEYFTNKNPEDRKIIAKELGCKAVLTQHSLFFLKMFLYYSLEYKESVTGIWGNVIDKGKDFSGKLKSCCRSYPIEEDIIPSTPATQRAEMPIQPEATADRHSGLFHLFGKFSKDMRIQCGKIAGIALSSQPKINEKEECHQPCGLKTSIAS